MLKIVGLVILAVVVIGGLGALGYYLGTNSTPSTTVTPTQTIEPIETPTPTATPSPTEDFTTFRGQSYTISYPEDWEVVEDVEPKTVGKESYTSIVKGDPIESTVNIFVEKTITYDKFLPKDSYTADDVTEKMMWGDFEVTLVKQEDDYNQYIFVEEGENTYIINSWGTADDQNTINLILSTFKINLTTQS
jgi:hypothetical protein